MISLAFPEDVFYNAITIKIIHPEAEPFQIWQDGHILSISIAGFLRTLIEGDGQILFNLNQQFLLLIQVKPPEDVRDFEES